MRVKLERILQRIQANNPAEKIIIEVDKPHDECSDIEVEGENLQQGPSLSQNAINLKWHSESIKDDKLKKLDGSNHQQHIVIRDDNKEQGKLSTKSLANPVAIEDKQESFHK